MNKTKLIQFLIIIAILSGLGAAGWFGYKEIRKAVSGPSTSSGQAEKSQKGQDPSASSGQDNVYTHPDYGFTLRYPGNLNLGKFPEGEGEIILFQGANGQTGFQIYITAYAEEEPFSFEVIKKSAPDLKIENQREIELVPTDDETGEEPITALSFDSDGEATGRTREIWFEAYGNLYQATSFLEYGDQMERILKSLRFN